MRPPYIFILFMFFFVSASFALTNINTCTDLTIPGETYNLTANLNGNQSNGICLNIVADNIVLECNGFNLTGEDNGTGIFAENKTDILVKNCNIKNYFFNLFFSNVSNGYVQNISSSRAAVVGFMGDKLKNLTINQSYFYGNEKNVYLLSSNNSRLLNVTSGYSGFPFPIYPKYGISVESSNYTEIRDSFVYGSQSAGIYHLNGRYLNVHNSQLGDAGVGNSKNNVSIFLENSLNSSITANVFSFQENVPELYGILIRNSNSSTISSNLINNSIIGIEVFLYTYDYSIFNNTIYVHNDSSSSPFGFQVGIDASFRGKIENNTIQAFCSNPCTMNNTVGIIVDNFHNSSNPIIISNNHLSYLNFGILTRLFVGSANISIYSNNISKIIASSTYDGIALALKYLNSSFISNNIINESIYGLYAEYAHNNTISGNNISYSSFGLYFKDSNFNNISYNYETNSTYGYVLNTADINILSGNTAFNNSKNGFYISGGGNTLENNTASFNREHGFAMIGSFDTNLTNNLAYRNSENNTDYAGFYIFLSIDINLVNNTAYSTGRGFWLADSFNTLLENNTAHSNTYGLYLENGNNTIAYNTHLYNDSQYDLYVKNDGMEDLYLSFTNLTIDNPFGNFKNYTSLHLDDIIMHGETYEISWTSNTQPLPLGRRPFANKFVNISTLHGLVSLDTVSWFWSDEEVTNEGVSEDKLELWKYNESGWTRLNNSPNIVFNFMTLTNHNPASKYGILEEVNCPIISSSGTYSQKANIGGAPNPAGIISESYYACVIINASNVEYDCAGYNITDTPSGNLTIGILINSSATNVTIKNCNIISNYTSAAILVFNASNATIFNTTVVNNMNGIVFVSSNFSKVYNNTVVNNTNSNFYLSVISSYNNISNNLIAFSERGFLISNGSSNNVFEYNIIQNHTDGVDILWVDSFLKTQNNTFYSNVFYNNTQFAFMIFNSSFDHYISNSISGGDAGFVTGFVDSAIFDSNNVSNTTYGFFVYQSNKNNLTFNQINDSYLAFFLNESSSNLVSTNKMYNLTYGAYFVYAVDNTFSNNSIQNVSRDGVYLRLVSNNNYIYNNTIFNTGRYGIYVDSTHNNTIDSNLVYYNINNAIALGNAQNNTIANNTVHSGNVYGISLSNSWYNKVLNNTGYNYTNSSAGYVLYLTSTSHYNNISYNKLYNGRYAYVLVSSSSNNILSYNYAENMTIDGYAIGDSSSNNTLMFNNATKCSHYAFEFYENASNNTMINNTAYSNYVGVYIRTNATLTKLYNNTIHSNQFYSLWINNGSQTYVEGDHYYNNTNDIRVLNGTYSYNLSRVIIDNPNGNFENYTVLSLDDSVGAGEEYYINWSKNSTTLPSNRFSFASKFVDISILSGAPSIDSITWHWLDSELTGYNESKFELWKYNSSGWTMLNNTPDISNNVLSLTNMNPASTYGILQNNGSTCVVINESGQYTITNNLTGAPYTISLSDVGMEVAVCIEINASDVEFDCQGYSITNNGTNAADGSAGIL
ncbi:MAG: right-handed parallel beta-helix repeat-containing protein, partial [Candidatus Bilamarchaeaceae archaeon]